MKKPLFLLMIAVLLMIAGCAANTPTVRRTYEQTPLDEIESRTSNHEEVVNLRTAEPKRRYFL